MAMEFNSLGANSINKLKCSLCQNYLSYFPIRVCPNHHAVCGRCPIDEEPAFHNIAFESISQFFKFPCRYQPQGCEDELQPEKIPPHEKTCKFRIIPCPTTKWTGCEWKGTRFEKLRHCEDEHGDLFATEFEIDLSRCDESYNLVNHEDLLMIFVRKFDVARKILKFEMYTSEFEVDKRYSCQLSAKCGNKNLGFDFVTTGFQDAKVNELNLDSIINQSDNQTVTVKILMGEELNPNGGLNLELLSVLKCFVCSEYSIPPIYHCVHNSETLCGDCNKTHRPSCAPCSQIANTRNINLDKMAHHLNYPCKFQKNGCTFISKPDEITKHQTACDLADLDCPIAEFEPCPWKGLFKDMEEHIQNAHQELVTNSSQLSKQLIPNRMKCDVVKFSDQLFRVVCLKTPEEKYMWAVQVVGPCKHDYMYEIEIVNARGKSLRLLVRQPCGALTKKDEIFERGDYCYFLRDQIYDFVVDQVVTFKIRIFM